MRRAAFISVTFHAFVAAAIALGLPDAGERPIPEGGIPVSLVTAAPGMQPPGAAARQTTARPTETPGIEAIGNPAAAATAHRLDEETVDSPVLRRQHPEPRPLPPAPDPMPPALPPPVAMQPDRKPDPPPSLVSTALPEPVAPTLPAELTLIDLEMVAADLPAATPPAFASPTIGTENADEETPVQLAHAATGTGGLPADDGGNSGPTGNGTGDDRAVAPAAGLAAAPAADPAAVADYAALLAEWLDYHKEYPERARRRNQQGVVLCEFTIAATGDVLNYRILEGSGFEILDEEANALIARASPLPPPPPGAASTYRVPIVFALR